MREKKLATLSCLFRDQQSAKQTTPHGRVQMFLLRETPRHIQYIHYILEADLERVEIFLNRYLKYVMSPE